MRIHPIPLVAVILPVLALVAGACVAEAPSDRIAADSVARPAVAPPGAGYTTFYIHGRMNVRAGPDTTFPILWKVERGDSIRMSPKDERGWARIEPTHGEGAGYIWRKSNLVRSYPPPMPGRRRR